MQSGVGREVAHQAIKEHAVATALRMRETPDAENNLLEQLARDSRLTFDLAELESLLAHPIEFTGDARNQVKHLADRVEIISNTYPEAATYSPSGIL